MPQIQPVPLYLKDVVLTIGTDSYEKTVSAVSFVPASTTATWQGLSPDATYTEQTSATWTCSLTYAQDWDNDDSLALFLYEHAGEKMPATFKPKRGSGGTWAADLVLIEGTVGGTVNAFAEATVTLGVDGRPGFTPAA